MNIIYFFMKFILKSLQNIDNLISYIFSNNANESQYLKNIFKDKKIICFDVGANLGGYSSFINKNLNVKELHIFEPSKECTIYLKKNYNEKKFKIEESAVTIRDGKRDFYENEILSQSSLHRYKNKFNKNYNIKKKYEVNCISLDNYCSKLSANFNIDILKIDAEGEDLNVLKGSKSLLSKKKIKIIKIELLNKINPKNKKNNLFEIINYLNSQNYYISSIVKTKYQDTKLLMMDAYFEPL